MDLLIGAVGMLVGIGGAVWFYVRDSRAGSPGQHRPGMAPGTAAQVEFCDTLRIYWGDIPRLVSGNAEGPVSADLEPTAEPTEGSR